MHCPACHQPVLEDAAACPQCGLSMAVLDRAFGIPPVLGSEIGDLASVLSRSQKRALLKVIAAFEARFPQVGAALVTCKPPPGIPLRGYLFWLFNRSQIVTALESGGANRLILMGLDPAAGQSACMVGYGLEPFLSPDQLMEALSLADAFFARGDAAKGVEVVLQRLAERLTLVSKEAPRAFGLMGETLESLEQLEDPPQLAALAY